MAQNNDKQFLQCLRFIEEGNTFFVEGSDQLINKAVISHINNVQDIKLSILAEDTELSDASISRYFKNRGFTSISMFRSRFYHFMVEHRVNLLKSTYSLKLNADENHKQLMDARTNILGEKKSDYTKAAEILKDCDMVLFVGEIFELTPFFPLQVLLICSFTPAFCCRTSELKNFPAKILKGNIAIVTTASKSEIAAPLKALRKKVESIKIIALGDQDIEEDNLLIPYKKSSNLQAYYEEANFASYLLYDAYQDAEGLMP